MLNSVKKILALPDKKKNSNSCVVRKKNSDRNKITITPPPFKLNGRSLKGQSEAVNRRTDNKMMKRIKTNNGRTTIYKALHIKLKIAQNLLTKGSRSKIPITLYLLSVSIFRKYP